MTKKASLSLIRLAAMKIQKNSHLVMKTMKLTMMLVTFHFWTASSTSFLELLPGSEELFPSITELYPKPLLRFTEKSKITS